MISKRFRVEEIPKDQATLLEDEMLVAVVQYSKELHSCFGNPFYLKVKDGERWYNIKLRIHQACGVTDAHYDEVCVNVFYYKKYSYFLFI